MPEIDAAPHFVPIVSEPGRLGLSRLASMSPDAYLREWQAVGRDIGIHGRLLARIGMPLSRDAACWNASRVLGMATGT